MAIFLELNENMIVINSIQVDDKELMIDGVEIEQNGIDFCSSLYGGIWIQTWTDGGIRKRFGGIGYIYDSTIDAFLSPKPYSSWVLNLDTLNYVSPVAAPKTDNHLEWDETTISWIEVTND